MEDSVYKMIKMPDNCQSGSQPQVNMEDIVNKMFKKCSKIPIIVRVDPTQDASSGTIEVREHCTRGRQRLMLSTFFINRQTKDSFIEFWFLHQQTFANKIHWPENRFLVFIQSVTVTVSLCTCETNYNLASANLSPTEIWRVQGDIWAPSSVDNPFQLPRAIKLYDESVEILCLR